MMTRGLNAVIAATLSALLLLGGCREDKSKVKPDPPQPASYVGVLEVVNKANYDEKLSGVTITSESGEVVEMGSGKYEFKTDKYGDHDLQFAKDGYKGTKQSLNFAEGNDGDVVIVAKVVAMEKEEPPFEPWKFTYNLTVADAETGTAVNGATLTFGKKGSEEKEVIQLEGNQAALRFTGDENTQSEVYVVELTLEDYKKTVVEVIVPALESGAVVSVPLGMTMSKDIAPSSETYKLELTIVDMNTGNPLKSGTVKALVQGKPEVTGAFTDGRIELTVPVGSLSITITSPGYIAGNASVNIADATENTYLKLGVSMKYYEVPEDTGGMNGVQEEVNVGQSIEIVVPKVEADLSQDIVSVDSKLKVNDDVKIFGAGDEELSKVTMTMITTSKMSNMTISHNNNEYPMATFINGEFQPSGVRFDPAIEWEFTNPFGTLVPDQLGLLLKSGDKWVASDNSTVDYIGDGEFSAKIEHFSEYRVVLGYSGQEQATERETLEVDDIYNDSGAPMKDPTVKLQIKEGRCFTITPKQAMINAGYTLNSDEEKALLRMIEQSLEYRDGFDDFASMEINKATSVTEIPPGGLVQNEAYQEFVTRIYTFGVNGKAINIEVKSALSVVLNSKLIYDDHHHHHTGGGPEDGGAGGGTGGNI